MALRDVSAPAVADSTYLKENFMPRTTLLVASAMILGSLFGSIVPHVGAQEVTPAVTVPPSWNIPGIEVLASVSDPSLAPGMVLEFDRITWAPGFEVPMHYHPAIDILYVVSGSVAWSVEEGTAQVIRAAVDGTPVPVEMLEPGSEAVLTPGDVIIFDYPKTGMRHAARVVGDAPVIMLDPVLYDPGQELTVFPEGVTPVAEG
jgi:quercetin dioxygenase-like cupin family protein